MDNTEKKKKTKKRANGEGSLYERLDGTWAGVSRYKDNITGKTKKHFSYGRTKSEAIRKKKAWEKEFIKNNCQAPSKLTVGEWLDTWLNTYAKTKVRQVTWDSYRIIVKSHLVPSLGNIKLNELQPQQVQLMINTKLESGNIKNKGPLSPRRVEYIYSILHSALEQAAKNQIIARNVCNLVDKPKKVKHEFIPWTPEQTNVFLSSVKDSRLFPVYLTEWGAGLRRSELLGLKWEDISFYKGTLTVKRAYVRVKGGFKFGDPKTPRSRRTIPLPEAVIKTLKTWKVKQNQEKMAFPGNYNSLNMVFTNEVGEPINPDYLTRTFKKDTQVAKLPEIRFHDLRHGHATMLLELGEDIKVISDRLGHSTITLTADTYSHVREKMQKEASNKLDQVLEIKNNLP